ncbi:MAG: hypothetical protein LBT37_06340 [Lactobacillaceae bacterium]|jgi:hypothetical protein|nr:hypothetical protein [Lactobacillaceae bacterium]
MLNTKAAPQLTPPVPERPTLMSSSQLRTIFMIQKALGISDDELHEALDPSTPELIRMLRSMQITGALVAPHLSANIEKFISENLTELEERLG